MRINRYLKFSVQQCTVNEMHMFYCYFIDMLVCVLHVVLKHFGETPPPSFPLFFLYFFVLYIISKLVSPNIVNIVGLTLFFPSSSCLKIAMEPLTALKPLTTARRVRKSVGPGSYLQTIPQNIVYFLRSKHYTLF